MAPIDGNVYFINATSQQHHQHLSLLFSCFISFVQPAIDLNFVPYLSVNQQHQQLFPQSISANFPIVKQASIYLLSEYPANFLSNSHNHYPSNLHHSFLRNPPLHPHPHTYNGTWRIQWPSNHQLRTWWLQRTHRRWARRLQYSHQLRSRWL